MAGAPKGNRNAARDGRGRLVRVRLSDPADFNFIIEALDAAERGVALLEAAYRAQRDSDNQFPKLVGKPIDMLIENVYNSIIVRKQTDLMIGDREMNFQQAIDELANGNQGDEAVKVVAQAVAQASRRGEWYDGKGSTNVYDWVAEGDYSGNETVNTLATEWDK